MDRDWHNWIDRLKSDELTEVEIREFEEALRADSLHREEYLSALMAEVALEADGLPNPLAQLTLPTKRIRRWPRLAAMAAGFVTLVTASYFVGNRTRPGQVPQGGVSPDFLATVTDADALAEKSGLRIGQPLKKESIVVPENSEIGIAMRGGARLKIRGPADLSINGPDKIHLGKGRISTYAPSYAQGFTVDTVDGKVVDLGTRFVTAAGTGSGTEIHVLEGLVNAFTTKENPAPYSLKGQHAGILQGGKLEPTDFLAQRLTVPLDPVLKDQDHDGFPDEVENYYGSRANDASSRPEALRVEETFSGYAPGSIQGIESKAKGALPHTLWEGAGAFESEGLSFSATGKSLRTTEGAVTTTGETYVAALFQLNPKELPPAGVTYLSFLMKNPDKRPQECFAGLLLYQDDREELFVGKLSVANSYGSRLKQADAQDAFKLPMSSAPHLFVIRIDRTRLVTDIFVDPVPGEPESSAVRRFRYQDVPVFDRIAVRSGSKKQNFPSTFDEIRLGLTWDSVMPVK